MNPINSHYINSQKEILKSFCMIDEEGLLQKVNLVRFFYEKIKGFCGYADHTQRDLLDIHAEWLNRYQRIVQGKIRKKTNYKIIYKTAHLLNRSKSYEKIINNLLKKNLLEAYEITKKNPSIKSKILLELRDYCSELKAKEITVLVMRCLKDLAIESDKAEKLAAERSASPLLLTIEHEIPNSFKEEIPKTSQEEGFNERKPEILQETSQQEGEDFGQKDEGGQHGLPFSKQKGEPQEIEHLSEDTLKEVLQGQHKEIDRLAKIIAVFSGGAMPYVEREFSPQLYSLQQQPFQFITNLTKSPLFSKFDRLPEQQEYNIRFKHSTEELSAMAETVKQRGPLLLHDTQKLKRILVDLAQLKEDVVSKATLSPNDSATIKEKIDEIIKAVYSVGDWIDTLDSYLNRCGKVEGTMEELNSQHALVERLSDLSSFRIPLFAGSLCSMVFQGHKTSLSQELQNDISKRLKNDVDWFCIDLAEAWSSNYIDTIHTEQEDLLREGRRLAKQGKLSKQEGLYAAGILCQHELLNQRIDLAKSDFIKAAEIIDASIAECQNQHIWGISPDTPEHHRMIEMLKESAHIFRKGSHSLSSQAEQVASLQKSISDALSSSFLNMIRMLKTHISDPNASQTERNSAILELKRLFYAMKHVDFSRTEIAELSEFVRLQEKAKSPYNPLEGGSEQLRIVLAAERLPAKRSALGKMLSSILHPETWSQETRDQVSLWFNFMQLSSSVLQTAKTLSSEPTLIEHRAKQGFQKLAESIPRPELKNINKQRALLGNLLTSKFEILETRLRNQEPLGFHTERFPELGKHLIEILQNYPTKHPSANEISHLQERLHKELILSKIPLQPSSFQSLSFKEWYKLFTASTQDTEEIIPEDHSKPNTVPEKTDSQQILPLPKQLQIKPPPKKPQIAPPQYRLPIAANAILSRAAGPLSILKSITMPILATSRRIGRICRSVFQSEGVQDLSGTASEFVQNHVEKELSSLQHAVNITQTLAQRLETIQKLISSSSVGSKYQIRSSQILKQGIVSLKQAIAQDYQASPDRNSSLQDVALWLQATEDHRYLVAEFDNTLSTMEASLNISSPLSEKLAPSAFPARSIYSYDYVARLNWPNKLAANTAEIARMSSELNSMLSTAPTDLPLSQELLSHHEKLTKKLREFYEANENHEKAVADAETRFSRQSIDALDSAILSLKNDVKVLSKEVDDFRLNGLIHFLGEHRSAELVRFFNSSSLPIDNKLFLHVVGDVYGSSTNLEGGSSQQNIEYLLSSVKSRMDAIASNPLCTDSRKIDFCKSFFENATLSTNFLATTSKETFENLRNELGISLAIYADYKKSYKKFHQSTSAAIDNLKKAGDSFFYPTGWPQHAIALEVIREPGDSFTVRIYNTGEGSEGYGKVYIEGSEKSLPFTEIVNVNPANLKHILFYKAIWDLNIWGVDRDIGAQTFQRSIVGTLDGQPSTNEYSFQQFLTPQKSGTCSYRSLVAVLSQLLKDTKNPKVFEWELGVKTVIDFYRQQSDIDKLDEITLRNLRKGSHEMSLLTQHLHEKEMITDAENLVATQILGGIKAALNAAKNTFEVTTRANRSDTSITSSAPYSPQVKTHSYDDHWPTTSFPSAASSISPIRIPAFSELTISNDLRDIIKKCSAATASKDRVFFSYHFQEMNEIMLTLPSPNNPIWQKIPEKEISTVIKSLKEFGGYWMQNVQDMAIHFNDYSMFLPGNIFLGFVKLNTLLDCLGQRFNIKTGQKLPNLYQKSFEDTLYNKQSSFALNDPHWEAQMIELKAYWNKRKPLNVDENFVSFFATETIPPEQWHFLLCTNRVMRRDPLHGLYDGAVRKFTQFEFQQWAKDYLTNDPQAAEKLKANMGNMGDYPFHEMNSEILAVLGLASSVVDKFDDFHPLPKVLPEEFFDFWQMAMMTNYAYRGRFDKNVYSESLKDLFAKSPNYIKFSGSQNNFDDAAIVIFDSVKQYEGRFDNNKLEPAQRNLLGRHSKWEAYRWDGGGKAYSHLPDGHLFAERASIPKNMQSIWAEKTDRKRILISNIFGKTLSALGIKKETMDSLGIEKTREYLALSFDPEQQISDTISYFQRNQRDLQTLEGRWLFERLLFEPPLLMQELLKEPAISQITIDQLASFLEREYSILQSNDHERIIFILRIHRLIKEKIDYAASQKYPGSLIIPPSISNFHEKVSQFLQESKKPEFSEALHREVLASLSKTTTLTESEIYQLISSNLAIGRSTKAAPKNRLTSIEAEQALAKHARQISEYFDKNTVTSHSFIFFSSTKLIDKPNIFFNEIARNHYPAFPKYSLNWKPYDHYPLFTAKDPQTNKNYLIDIHEGRFLTSDGILNPLPRELLENSKVANLLKSHSHLHMESAGLNIWKLTTADGTAFRFKATKPPVIQKFINGRWMQLVDNVLSINPLNRDKYQWSHKEKKISSLFGPEVSVIYIEDQVSAKPIAQAITDIFGKIVVHQLDSQGKETGLVLDNVKAPGCELGFLTDIEDGAEIIFWRDEKTHTPTQAQLPSLGLSFSFKADGAKYQMISNEFPGYIVSGKQSLPPMKGAGHYLILEKDGKRKILIPRKFYATEGVGVSSLRTASILENKGDKFQVFTYDADETDNDPLPNSYEGGLFLASIYLWHHHYHRALRGLQKDQAYRRRQLTPSEMEALKRIARLRDINHDASPEAAVVSLHAAMMMLYSIRNFGFKEKPDAEASYMPPKELAVDAASKYLYYISQLSSWGNLGMSVEEEIFLIDQLLKNSDSFSMIGKSIDLIERRQAHLQGKPSEYPPVPAMLRHQPLPPVDLGKVVEEIRKDNFPRLLLSETQNIAAMSLVDGSFGSYLPELYEAIREQNEDNLRKALKQITELDYPSSLTLKELAAELAKTLLFLARLPLRIGFNTPAIALLLKFILENPGMFPRTSAFKETLADSKLSENEKGKWIKKEIVDLFLGSYSLPSTAPITTGFPAARKIISVPEKLKPMPPLPQQQVVALEKPSAPAIQEYTINYLGLNITKLPLQNLMPIRKSLTEIFNIPMKDAVADGTRQKLLANIAAYEAPAETENYILGDLSKALALKGEVEADFLSTQKQMGSLQIEIEDLINTPPSDSVERAKERLGRVAGQRRRLDIRDAIFAYWRSMGSQHLRDKVHAWLMLTTNADKQTLIINAIENIQSCRGKIPQGKINALCNALSSKRVYDPADHPEYLVLESHMKSLLWAKQREALDKLLIHNGVVGAPQNLGVAYELLMGSGKSAVLLPLLSILFANGKDLVWGIMPAPLIPEAAEGLSKRSGGAFQQALNVFKVERQTPLDENGLNGFKKRLTTSIHDRQFNVGSDHDVQGLFLKFAEAISKFSQLPSNAPERAAKLHEISQFRSIFRVLGGSGIALVDEIDLIMNVLLSHHYTIGKHEAIHQSYIEGSAAFFKALLTSSNVMKTFGNEVIGYVTADNFKPLVNSIAQEISLGHPFNENSLTARYLTTLEPKNRDLVITYLTGSSNDKSIFDYIDSLPEEIQDVLTVIREELTQVASLTLSKKLFKDYGPPPSHLITSGVSRYSSIIYQQGKPLKNSQPGTTLEMVHYTLQPYLLLGIPQEIIVKELQAVQNEFSQARVHTDQPLKLGSYQLLQRYFGETPFDPLQKFTPEQVNIVSNNVKKNPGLIIDLAVKYILAQIDTYPTQLHSNAHISKMFFKRTYGLTGTLDWNLASLPDLFYKEHFSDTTEKTLFLLMSKQKPKNVIVIDPAISQTLKEIISEVYQNQQGSSIIDAAGMFLEMDREQVAREMLSALQKRGDKTKGVAFCDLTDRWMVIESSKENQAPVSLANTKLDSSEISVFWDLEHTTGSDVRTKPDETAILFFGRFTLLRDLLQAIWRLRKFDQDQSVTFAISKADEQVVRATLQKAMGKEIEGPVRLEHLLQFALYEQAMKVGDFNYRALKYRLDAAILEKVWNLMQNPKVADEKIAHAFKLIKSLFETTTPQRPYLLYGKAKSMGKRDEAVEILLQSTIDGEAMKAILSDPFLSGHIDIENLKKELRIIVEKHAPALPDQLEIRQGYGLQRQVQVQTQTETEVESEVEQQTSEVNDLSSEGLLVKERYKTWPESGLFTKDYFSSSDIVTVSQFFDMKKRSAAAFIPSFSNDLLATNNFAAMHLRHDPLADPFALSQEYPKKILVIQDKTTNTCKAVILDKKETGEFNKLLEKDLNRSLSHNRDVRLAVYDLETGVTRQSRDPVDFKKLEQSVQFLELKVQAKFFAGHLRYSKQEEAVLKSWIAKNNVDQMHDFFKKKVLSRRANSQEAFIHSDLERIFAEESRRRNVR